MAEPAVVHIGENSPEQVAYKLMRDINAAESTQRRSRKDILDLYAECLVAVRQPDSRLSGKEKIGSQ